MKHKYQQQPQELFRADQCRELLYRPGQPIAIRPPQVPDLIRHPRPGGRYNYPPICRSPAALSTGGRSSTSSGSKSAQAHRLELVLDLRRLQQLRSINSYNDAPNSIPPGY